MRTLVSCPNRPSLENVHVDAVTRSWIMQAITPIFGGGAFAGYNDPVTPVRPSSIRGHLRFWWRATRGTECKSVGDLHRREGDIWGTTESPSKAVIEVLLKSRGRQYSCAHFPPGRNFPLFERDHPPYALFPFQGNAKDDIPPAKCTSEVSFELRMTYPEALEKDVESAIWAWVNFGGIGARTRRGCGALYCSEFSPPLSDLESLKSWYKDCLDRFDVDRFSGTIWPYMPDDFLIRFSRGSNVLQAWSGVVGLMQTFRQGEGIGRNPGSERNRPGRSRWPEPETIRKATSRRSSRHSRMGSIPDDAFPRAEIGLPIVFHFKDYDDPKDSELYPVIKGEKKSRMASPLILRPMKCQNGQVIECILRLITSPPDGLVLENGPEPKEFNKIADPTLKAYPRSPLGSPKAGDPVRSYSGSAVEGFLAFAQEPGNDFLVVS